MILGNRYFKTTDSIVHGEISVGFLIPVVQLKDSPTAPWRKLRSAFKWRYAISKCTVPRRQILSRFLSEHNSDYIRCISML